MMLAALMLPFVSQAQVTTFPYSCDFEDATEAAAWTFDNGTLTNQWVLGTAANNTTTGSYGIYISNDAGANAAYTVSSSAVAYAYREFYLTPGEYTVSFDWQCNGESTWDYLLAALVESSVTLTAGTALPTGVSYTSMTASGWTNLGPTSPNLKMNLSTSWNTQTATFTVTTAGTYRIVFVWRNDSSGGTAPGACVDNVVVTQNSCPMPSGLLSNNITTTSVDLTWTELGSASSWLIYVDGEYAATANSTSYSLTGLNGNTVYTISVRSLCGVGDTSNAVTGTFRTACPATTTLPFSENFSGYTGLQSTPYYGPAVTPSCWDYYSNGTNTAETSGSSSYYGGVAQYNGTTSYASMEANNPYLIMPIYVVGSAVTSSTYIGYGEARGNTKIAILPAFAENLNTLQISFDYKMSSAYSATGAATTLELGYVTGADIEFTSMQLWNSVSTTQHIVDLNLSTLAASAPAGARLAFKFSGVHNGTSTSSYSTVYCGIDNVVVETLPSCARVTNLTTGSITSSSVELTWVDAFNTGATYTVYDMSDTSLVATGINALTYTVTGLNPNTQYSFGVIANCSATDLSNYTTISATTACASETMPWSENFDDWTAKSPCWSFLSGQYNGGAGTPTTSTSAWTLNTTYGSYITISGKALTMNLYSSNKYWAVTPLIEITGDALLTLDVAASAWSAAAPNYDDNDTLAIAISTDGGTTFSTLQVLAQNELNALTGTYTTLFIPVTGYTGSNVRFAIYGGSTSGTSPYDNRIAIDNITVTASTGDICYAPTNLTVSNITETGATLSWVGTASSYNVYTITDTDTTLYQNVTDTSIVFTGLTAMTNYTYGVRAVCSSDESQMVVISFSTACSALTLPYTETFEATSAALGCWSVEGPGSWAIGTGDYSATTGAFEGATNAKITHGSTGNTTKLISPVLDGVVNGMTLDFAHIQRSWSGDQDELRVYYRVDADSAWQQVAEYTNEVSAWTVESLIIPGEVYQVAFEMTDGYGYGVAVDSVVFTEMSASFCYPVSDLTVDSVTATSVFLSWNDTLNGGATYSIYGSDGTVVATGVTATSYEVTGLTASTSYTFGVVANCSSTDASNVVTINATTDCAGGSCQITIAAIDGYGDGWDDSYIAISQNGATIATYNMASQGVSSTLIYDTFQVSVCSGLPVTFSWTSGSNYDDEAGFQIIDGGGAIVYTVSDASTITEGTVFYTMTEACPSCATPVVTVDAATETSITIIWTGNAASYNVYNGTTYVANVTTNTYTFTGLNASASYTFGVQAICSATDSSSLVSVTAMTSCADISSLPYFEGFENGLGCWNTINGSADGQPWFTYNCASLADINPHSGNYVASSWSWNGSAIHADAWLISPRFILPTVNAGDSITFSWWEIANSSYPDSYSVAISTTTDDTSSFTVVRPSTAAAGTWTQQSIDLTSYAGQSVYVAFHHVDYDENYLLIDDVEMFVGSYVPPAPDTLTVVFQVDDPIMGTTVPAPGTYQYLTGDTVHFGSQRNPGYRFQQWVITYGTGTDAEFDTIGSEYANGYYILANALMSYGSVTFKAFFEAGNPDSIEVTYAVNDATMGTTNPAPGVHSVYVGDDLLIEAVPNTGYMLSAWAYTLYMNGNAVASDTVFSGDEGFTNPKSYGSVPQSYVNYGITFTFTAIFEVDTTTPPVNYYNVTVNYDANMGTVTGIPTEAVEEGTSVTLTANANDSYEFVGWVVDNDTLTVNPYTFTVNADVTINALFKETVGINTVNELNVNVYSVENNIIVRGAAGYDVYVFDINGRAMAKTLNAGETAEFRMPATGVYIVRIGDVMTKRVVVVR